MLRLFTNNDTNMLSHLQAILYEWVSHQTSNLLLIENKLLWGNKKDSAKVIELIIAESFSTETVFY